jgi:hypothetical protein
MGMEKHGAESEPSQEARGGERRGPVVAAQAPPAQRRRRSGSVLMAGVVCVGCVLVSHTLWESSRRPGNGTAAAGAVQALHQIFRGDLVSPSESKAVGFTAAAHGPAEPKGQAAPAVHNTALSGFFDQAPPEVSSIDMKYNLLRAVGGQVITVYGKNFGDEDSDTVVKIGNTVADSTSWVSPHKLLVKTPPGVGKDLDVTVEVMEPARPKLTSVKPRAFSYSPPYIFDIAPFIVGQPVMGPMDITIHAYGVGPWDTHPVASINGQQCGTTTWVDNQTVVCSLKDGTRVELQNPEVKVAGQRSHCGIVVSGICTVSADHNSVNSVARLKEEIALLRARGGDVNELKKKINRMKARQGMWLGENDANKPCDNVQDCYPTTLLSSLTSALLMMMGMGSICLVLIVLRPFSQWVHKEFFEEEEELDEDDPANARALRAREFDPRVTLTGL